MNTITKRSFWRSLIRCIILQFFPEKHHLVDFCCLLNRGKKLVYLTSIEFPKEKNYFHMQSNFLKETYNFRESETSKRSVDFLQVSSNFHLRQTVGKR